MTAVPDPRPIIKVPLVRPPSWAPAWPQVYPGQLVALVLSLGDELAVRGTEMAQVSVSADPAITLGAVTMWDDAVVIQATMATPSARAAIRTSLLYTSGEQDVIEAWMWTRAAPLPGLLPGAALAAITDADGVLQDAGGVLISF